MKSLLLLTSYFLLLTFSLFSQSNQNIPLYREKNILYEKQLNSIDCKAHTSIKPYINTPALEAISDSLKKNMARSKNERASIISSETKKSNTISISGILNCQFYYSENIRRHNSGSLVDEGGLRLQGTHGNKLSYNLTFLSGYSGFLPYVDTFITKSRVIPGMGSAYYDRGAYSYQYYSGYLSYSPNKIFNFQIGKDKHFWGDGYRSLFLSDVSNSFPFLKITTTIWKFQYTSLFTWMKDVTAPSGLQSDFKNKFGSFHYLSWNVTKRFNLGFFESVIWQGADANRTRSFDVDYLNPVIFYRPVEYSLGSSDNVLLGLSFKEKVAKKQQFYGQFLLDEFLLKEQLRDLYHDVFPNTKHVWGWWGNKYGVQLGFKSFDLFTLKNLSFQTEGNYVRPYTYSHGSVQQNYANYNQPLAHPLGSNFVESVSFLNYRYKKWMLEGEFLYAIYGKDSVGGRNLGNNIFLPYGTRASEYGNYMGQGIKTNLRYVQLKLSYYLIPSADLLAEIGVAVRQEKNSYGSLNSNFIFIGIKTGIMNRYSDF